MLFSFRHFQLHIEKDALTTEDGRSFQCSAVVRFHLPGSDRDETLLMPHVNKEDIYGLLDTKGDINLNGCYVESFSLKEYRQLRGLDPTSTVEIGSFTADDAFFGEADDLDMAGIHVKGESFRMERSRIEALGLNFEASRFDCKELSFHDSHLGRRSFNFKNVDAGTAFVDFKNCVFGKGTKDFQYARFCGEVCFVNAEFTDGDVNFINATFKGPKASFKVARFGRGKVDFHFASFKDVDLSFERSEFNSGRVDFRTVEFGKGRVNFNRSDFGSGEVVFDECEMDGGKFSFKRASLGQGPFSFDEAMFDNVDVSFERTAFGNERVSFYKSWFNILSLNFCHLDGFLDIRVSGATEIDLSNTVVRDIVDMNPHEFTSEVGLLYMGGMRLLGHFYIDWKHNRVESLINDQPDSTCRSKAEQFRILKENFKAQGLYNAEDSAYVEFKRNEARAHLREGTEHNKTAALREYPLYWFKLGLFDRAGLYATSPVRVLSTMLVTFVSFSIIYTLMLTFGDADIVASVDDQLSVVARSFYHSAITFLTIGYGDHYPYGAVRWVSAIEGFFGLFLMSYFTVAFVRKVLR